MMLQNSTKMFRLANDKLCNQLDINFTTVVRINVTFYTLFFNMR